MRIDSQSHVPIFQQIADGVRSAIAGGVYRPGEGLPSVRAMAIELRVNPNTVQRAYEALERDGVVESRRGVGMFVLLRGAQSAKNQAEAAVQATLQRGVRLARSANMSEEQVQAVFDKVIDKVSREKAK